MKLLILSLIISVTSTICSADTFSWQPFITSGVVLTIPALVPATPTSNDINFWDRYECALGNESLGFTEEELARLGLGNDLWWLYTPGILLVNGLDCLVAGNGMIDPRDKFINRCIGQVLVLQLATW